MSLNYVKVVIFVSLATALVVVDVNALKCVSQTACSCHFIDGSFFDLTKVSPDKILHGDQFNYTYAFQPCHDVKITLDPPKNSTNACNTGEGVSLCARHSTEDPFSLGTTSETKWNFDEQNPKLILTHGTNISYITLLCRASAQSPTMVLDGAPSGNKFTFILSSAHVCIFEGPPEGISTGSVLVILLFVFSGIYLFVGALALRYFRGAIGWELIPNYDFWSDLPALVRDGIAFTFSGCSVDSYDRI